MIQAWPFLVSRNRTLDYRTIAAPDFLVDAGEAGHLAANASSDADGRRVTRPLSTPRHHALSMVYETTDACIDGAPVLDSHGRPIEWTFGVVLKGDHAGGVDDAVFDQARDVALDHYRAFLPKAAFSAPYRTSAITPADAPRAATRSPAASPDGRAVRSTLGWGFLVAAGLVSFVGASAGGWLGAHRGARLQLQQRAPEAKVSEHPKPMTTPAIRGDSAAS
jgi:hypothetical protein